MHVYWGKSNSLLLLRYFAIGLTTIRDMPAWVSNAPARPAKRAVAIRTLLGPHL